MRQKGYKDRTTISLSIERDIKKEIERIAGKESFSSFVNRVLEEEIEKRKNQEGLLNPINITYEAPNKVMSLLHYLQETIDSEEIRIECSKINDHKTLTRLKGMAYTINKSVDQQSLLLYKNGIKT